MISSLPGCTFNNLFSSTCWNSILLSKTHHFSATILCILLQDYIFAWIFPVTRPKRFIHFYLMYHICFFPRWQFRRTVLISVPLQTLSCLIASAFLQHARSINNPGHQDNSLKTSLANIHCNKPIRFWLSVLPHSSFSFIHLIFPIFHIPDRLCIHGIKSVRIFKGFLFHMPVLPSALHSTCYACMITDYF